VTTGVVSTTAGGSEAGGCDDLIARAYLVRVANAAQPLVPSSRHALDGVDIVRFHRGPLGVERLREESARVLQFGEPDARISTAHACLRRVLSRWVLEDLGSKNGTWVGGVRVQSVALNDGDVIEVGRTFYLFRDGVAAAADEPLDVVAATHPIAGMATLSPSLARDLRDLGSVARSMAAVVLHGETGTGKELLARAIHTMSGRTGPFVAVNCAAIPDALVASELFGVRRGAYSDAKEDRPGLVRSAHRGTLFLDEIADLKLELQPVFLRVLQEPEVVPVGQAGAISVDVRVVSATNRRLESLVAAKDFREDLWARLAGFTTCLPPLRARREDLGLLIAAIVRRHGRVAEEVSFHSGALRSILLGAWPRNIRELDKRLEAALALAGDSPIDARHLGEVEPLAREAAPLSSADDARRAELEHLLGEHRGNVAAVARALGKDRVQIRRWLARYGLSAATSKR
jgi:DNA-binding NtrC family response regulator